MSNWLIFGISLIGCLFGVLIIAFTKAINELNPNSSTAFMPNLGILYLSFFGAYAYLVWSSNQQILIGKRTLATTEAVIGILVGLIILADPILAKYGFILIANFAYHLYSLWLNKSVRAFIDRVAF